jgi:hypothetical protein
MDTVARANTDYMVRLANDPAWAAQELAAINEFCASHGALYAGKPVPVPIKPHFISVQQRKLLEQSVARIHSALEKFILFWLDDEDLQRDWGVSDDEMALYRVDPGYKNAIQIARFDAFLHDTDVKFLEFNCDSPGGTGYADTIHRGFLEMLRRNRLTGPFHVSTHSLLHLAETLTACYNEWRANGHGDHPESPFIAVSDWRDVGTIPDIEITITHLRESGLDAVFADPRDLEHRDDGLYMADRRVDVVYKRVIVKELVSDPAARPFADAYKAGQVCLVNSPRSAIVGNKKILAAIRRPEIMARLGPLERQAVRDHVPWTEILRDAKVDFQGFDVNLRDFVRDNKDLLVLKAAQSYGGRDVFLGFETPDEAWRALVDKHIAAGAWVVQELVKIPKELFPEVRDGQVDVALMNVNINPLVFGGKYVGSYTRLSKKNIINVSFGGGMTATMTLEPLDA